MNNRENDDELERVRTRARGDGIRQDDGSYWRFVQSVRERRSTRQSYDDRDGYDKECYYDEECGMEGDRQVNFPMGDYLDDESPVSSRRLRFSHGSSDSARGRQAQSAGSRQAQSGKSRQVGSAASSLGRARAAQTVSRNQRHAGYRRQNTMEGGRASVGRQREQMTKRRKKGRWKGLLLLLPTIFIGYGAWMFLHRPTGYQNVAVFGADSRDGNTKNALTDVQMICSINRSTGEIRLINVYRDIHLKINPEGAYHKINEAYFKGGHKQAVSALGESLDIKTGDHATLNWKSVVEATSILGGIDLEITPTGFRYINGFITEIVSSTGTGSHQLGQTGINRLDNVQAVACSRLRLTDTGFRRAERQRKIAGFALIKAEQVDVSTLTSLTVYTVQEISTSIGVGDVLLLSKDTERHHTGETAGFPFPRQTKKIGKMDCMVSTALKSNMVLLHQSPYGEGIPYSPPPSVRKINARISEGTGPYGEGKAAPFGGGSSGSGSSGGKTPAQNVPTETPPPGAAVPGEITPESAEKTEETIQESVVETEKTEGAGPGTSDRPTKASESAENPDEEQGPGVNGPGGSDAEEPSADYPTKAPKTEKPGSGSGSGSDNTSQGPRSQGNDPGQAQSGTDKGGPGM